MPWNRALFGVGVGAWFAGCSYFVPVSKTPADRARDVLTKCRDVPEPSAAPLLARDAADSVEPAYAFVAGGPNGRDAHLRGARIHLRPLPGLTREAATRSLECHEARVTLGQAPAAPDDPYVAAGSWVTIDVDSEGDGFTVLLSNDDFDTARRILDQARLFARSPHRN